jgi:hypothetical protein
MPPLPPPTYKFKYFFSSKNLAMGGHLAILGCDVVFHLMVIFHLLLPCFLNCVSNLSNLNESEYVMSLSESSHTFKENLPIPSR